MYWRAGLLVGLGSLLSAVNALTITSPSGGTVDPTKAITVTWTHTSSDPSTFNLVFGSTDPGSVIESQTIGTDISTDAGTFTIPANSLTTYGSLFVLKAQGGSGNDLATSGTFSLAQGDLIQTTDAQGQTTLISSSLVNGAGATSSPLTAVTTGSQNSPTASVTGTEPTPRSTGSSETGSFRTSTTTGRSTGASSSSSSSATASTSANAQPRLGSSSEMVLSAAGVLAGMVALFA